MIFVRQFIFLSLQAPKIQLHSNRYKDKMKIKSAKFYHLKGNTNSSTKIQNNVNTMLPNLLLNYGCETTQ